MSARRRSLPAPPNILWRLFVVVQLVRTLMEREFAGLDVSRSDFAVLSTIGATRAITPTDLAELLGTPPTTLSAMLKRLERRRLIRRRANPEDRRSVLIELTGEGALRWEAGSPALVRTVTAIVARLEGQEQEVAAALELYENALRAALDDSAISQ